MQQRRFLPVAGIMLTVLAGTAALGVEFDSTTKPDWWRELGLWFKPYAIQVSIVFLGLAALAQGLSIFLAGPIFRRRTIQRTIDILVSECTGREKQNRVTVFKKVSGFRASVGGLKKLGIIGAVRKENRARVRALWRLQLHHEYLVVYARSSHARHPNSTTCWRVSDEPTECLGVAGKVWDEGVWYVPDLPQLKEVHREDIAKAKTMEELLRGRGPNDALRRYLEKTGQQDLEQLKAVGVLARHFFGQVIQTESGPWGVLLLDSESDKCPFTPPNPHRPGETAFERVFNAEALTLGNMLQGA